MTLDEKKVAELQEKLKKEVAVSEEPTADVPPHIYKRAKKEMYEGVERLVYTRVRTQTIEIPSSRLDEIVDQVCNGTEEEWFLKHVVSVAKRPTKYSGGSTVLAVFLCVDKFVLPDPPKEDSTDPAEIMIDADTQDRAKEWEETQKN